MISTISFFQPKKYIFSLFFYPADCYHLELRVNNIEHKIFGLLHFFASRSQSSSEQNILDVSLEQSWARFWRNDSQVNGGKVKFLIKIFSMPDIRTQEKSEFTLNRIPDIIHNRRHSYHTFELKKSTPENSRGLLGSKISRLKRKSSDFQRGRLLNRRLILLKRQNF